jgi:hypothetical protein
MVKIEFMKKFLTCAFLVFFANNAFAINLGDVVKEVGGGSGGNVTKKLDDKIDKVVGKFEGKLEKYEEEARGEIDKYKQKIEAEEKKVTGMIKEAQDSVNKLKEIKANAYHYINIAKIVLAVLSSGILILIFVMWRIWKNIVNMKKIIRNVTNYDDVNKRLQAVEKAVGLK